MTYSSLILNFIYHLLTSIKKCFQTLQRVINWEKENHVLNKMSQKTFLFIYLFIVSFSAYFCYFFSIIRACVK